MGISSSYPQSSLQSSFGYEELMCLLHLSFQDDIALISKLTFGDTDSTGSTRAQTRVMLCRLGVTIRMESHRACSLV